MLLIDLTTDRRRRSYLIGYRRVNAINRSNCRQATTHIIVGMDASLNKRISRDRQATTVLIADGR